VVGWAPPLGPYGPVRFRFPESIYRGTPTCRLSFERHGDSEVVARGQAARGTP
jgi:hypothetical protein